MTLRLENLSLSLAEFELSIDTAMSAAAIGIFGQSGAGKTICWKSSRDCEDPTAAACCCAIECCAMRRAASISRRASGTSATYRRMKPSFPICRFAPMRSMACAGGRRTASSSAIAAMLEIEPLLDRSVGRLSGGERRRIALARALMTSPAVLLLDEPLSGLDTTRKDRTLELLRSVRTHFRTPTVLVSHDRAEVRAFCDEVLVLDRGRVIAHGPTEEVLSAES